MGSSPGEDTVCSSDTKHNSRMVPRPKRLLSLRLQEQWLDRTPKPVFSLSPGENRFCNPETEHDRRMAPRPTLLVSSKRLQEERMQSQDTPGFKPQ